MSAIVRHLHFYDGRTRLGSFTITRRSPKVHAKIQAKDAAGKKLGTFKTQRAAIDAIDKAALRSISKAISSC